MPADAAAARSNCSPAAGISARQVLREKGTPFHELGLADPSLTDAALLDSIDAHPILINRPIVVTPKGVRLCRPSEAVLDISGAAARRVPQGRRRAGDQRRRRARGGEMNNHRSQMKTIQVFDPALCCSTGVCGVDVDQALGQLRGRCGMGQAEGRADRAVQSGAAADGLRRKSDGQGLSRALRSERRCR